MQKPAEFFASVRAKQRDRHQPAVPPAEAPVIVEDDDEDLRDPVVLALESELAAAQTAQENEAEWNGRGTEEIEAELVAAETAAQLASKLPTRGNKPVTRQEFEAFKDVIALVFADLAAVSRDNTARPGSILESTAAASAEIGMSAAQTKELKGLLQRINVLQEYYGHWDRRTGLARRQAAFDAMRRRPPLI